MANSLPIILQEDVSCDKILRNFLPDTSLNKYKVKYRGTLKI